jgi:hypothetical protein
MTKTGPGRLFIFQRLVEQTSGQMQNFIQTLELVIEVCLHTLTINHYGGGKNKD